MEGKKFKIIEETVEFSEELYQKNIQENKFPRLEDGMGGDDNADN